MVERRSDASGEVLYDAVVIGGGAAGQSAALVLARARRRVAVVDAGQPRNAPAEHMHGFLSRDGMPPAELLATGRAELAAYGVEVIEDRVDHLAPGFSVRLASGRAMSARQVVVATGLTDELPDLPGVRERWGKDVVQCPYCHGYEVRDQPIGVLGTVAHALLLRQWSDDVVYFPHTTELTGDERERLTARGVRIAEGVIDKLRVHDERLHGVELADGRVVPRSAFFLVPRMVPNDFLLIDLGCDRNGDGWVLTDPTGRTSVQGAWAVGNVVNPRAQVITAAGMGAAAAFAMNLDLVDADVAQAVAEHRTGDAVVRTTS